MSVIVSRLPARGRRRLVVGNVLVDLQEHVLERAAERAQPLQVL